MSSSSAEGSPEEYEVLRIVECSVDEEGTKWYRVKWCDGPNGEKWSADDADTWQLEGEMNCPDKLAEFKAEQRAAKRRKKQSMGGGESSKKSRKSVSKERSISKDRDKPGCSGSNAQKKTTTKKRAFIESDDEDDVGSTNSRSSSKSRTTGLKKDERARSSSTSSRKGAPVPSSSTAQQRQQDAPCSSAASDVDIIKAIAPRPDRLILKIPKAELNPAEKSTEPVGGEPAASEKEKPKEPKEKEKEEAEVKKPVKIVIKPIKPVAEEKAKEPEAPAATQPLPAASSAAAVAPPAEKEAEEAEEKAQEAKKTDEEAKEEEKIVEEVPEDSKQAEPDDDDALDEEEEKKAEVVQPVLKTPLSPRPVAAAPTQYIDVEDYDDDSDEDEDSDDSEDEEDEEEAEEVEEKEDDEHAEGGSKVYDKNGKFMYTIRSAPEDEKNGYELGHEGIIVSHDTFEDPSGQAVRFFRVVFEDLDCSQYLTEELVKRHDSDAYGVYMTRLIEHEEQVERLRDIRLRMGLLNSE